MRKGLYFVVGYGHQVIIIAEVRDHNRFSGGIIIEIITRTRPSALHSAARPGRAEVGLVTQDYLHKQAVVEIVTFLGI